MTDFHCAVNFSSNFHQPKYFDFLNYVFTNCKFYYYVWI